MKKSSPNKDFTAITTINSLADGWAERDMWQIVFDRSSDKTREYLYTEVKGLDLESKEKGVVEW